MISDSLKGSKSSKCTEIKTPVDPTKLRFIDNKRISIIIGCVAGILVFILIIISIVMNREDKEEEEEEDSIAGSHKSPGSKTNRSDSLTFQNSTRANHANNANSSVINNNPGQNPRLSRANSQSSSLLNNRLSLAEAAGPEALPITSRHVRNGSSVSQQQQPSSGTLKRGALSRQQSRDTPQVRMSLGTIFKLHFYNLIRTRMHSCIVIDEISVVVKAFPCLLQGPPPPPKPGGGGGRLMSKQSSTESGPSSSNRLSRQSSSETTMGGVNPPGNGSRNPYQSWHGTPRADPRSQLNHRPSNAGQELNSLPRRNLDKRRSVVAANNDPSAAIPLIEYSLVENGHHGGQGHYSTLDRGGRNNPAVSARKAVNVSYENHVNHLDSEAAEAEDYYPDTTRIQPARNSIGGGGGGYVKYNSFANY